MRLPVRVWASVKFNTGFLVRFHGGIIFAFACPIHYLCSPSCSRMLSYSYVYARKNFVSPSPRLVVWLVTKLLSRFFMDNLLKWVLQQLPGTFNLPTCCNNTALGHSIALFKSAQLTRCSLCALGGLLHGCTRSSASEPIIFHSHCFAVL